MIFAAVKILKKKFTRRLFFGVFCLIWISMTVPGIAAAATITLAPNAAGSETNLTPGHSSNWSMVAAEDEDYISNNAMDTWATDTYNVPNQTPAGVISNVTVYIVVMGDNEGARAKTVCRMGGTDYLGADNLITAGYTVNQTFSTSYDENPNTTAAWTWTDINNLQIGVALGLTGDSIPYCDRVYAVVTYLPDTTPPTITGLSNDIVPKKTKAWDWDSEAGTTFRFAVNGNATSTLSGAYGAATTTSQSLGNGIYYLHVQAKDAVGNESSVVTVSAVIDNTAPVITIAGGNPVNIVKGSTYIDAGATAADNIDLAVAVSTSGSVDTSTAGNYHIVYSVTDVSGNAITATRTVNVNANVAVAAVPGQALTAVQINQSQMLAQIQYLRSEIARLQKFLADRRLGGIAANSKYSCSAITKNLFYGISNDPQVRCLQEFLKSQGAEIYPEANITGSFFGATKAAVIRFQEKHRSEILIPSGMAQGNGAVGFKTSLVINRLLGGNLSR